MFCSNGVDLSAQPTGRFNEAPVGQPLEFDQVDKAGLDATC